MSWGECLAQGSIKYETDFAEKCNSGENQIGLGFSKDSFQQQQKGNIQLYTGEPRCALFQNKKGNRAGRRGNYPSCPGA
jgi:hypothetical protein